MAKMENINLESTQISSYLLGGDLEINRLGFGAMRITGNGIWGPPENREGAIQVLRDAVNLGVNFIDTADSYGPNVSEELIAEALYPYPSNLIITTKGGYIRPAPDQWKINASPDQLKRALEGSLKRLKKDCIDLYLLHRVDPEVPIEKSLKALQQAQDEGMIKHIGLSEVGFQDLKKAEDYVWVVSVQNKFNLEFRQWEPMVRYTHQQGIAFIPWYPMNGGHFAKSEPILRICKKYDASIQQIYLKWLFMFSPNIILIPGTSNPQHMKDNYQALDVPLEKEDFELICNLYK